MTASASGASPVGPDERGARPWRMLALLALAELLGMSPWFTAAAISPELAARWGLDPGQVGWLTGAVQIGFVAGTALAALLNLADLVPSRAYFAAAAVGAAGANASLLAAGAFPAALASRFLTGFFLAGVYPPAMKMAATWFSSWRGLAIGTVVGALTIGKAMPYLLHFAGGASATAVVAGSSLGVLLAAALVGLFYRDGPQPFPRRPFSIGLAGSVLHERRTRLAIGSYLGHMWELYAMWTWLPAFLAAGIAAAGRPGIAPDLAAFGAIAAGGLGCVWGGWAARRMGYERVVIVSMAASGACALVIGLAFGGDPRLLVLLAWIWGFFVVADSAQFSALVTLVTPPHAVGTALTLQTSLGFLLTLATIQCVPLLQQAVGWRWAFAALALGPIVGIQLARTLAKARSA